MQERLPFQMKAQRIDFIANTDAASGARNSLLATATSFDSNPASAGFMKFSGATMVSGDTNIFNAQFASGFSAPDFDNDTHTANCAIDYSGVSQHYSVCWSYNLGSDADTPYYDGGVGL